MGLAQGLRALTARSEGLSSTIYNEIYNGILFWCLCIYNINRSF